MNKLRSVKKGLKRNHVWKQYKKMYKHKQMRFLFSNVALILKPEIDLNELIEVEKNLAIVEKDPEMFVKEFLKLKTLTKTKFDWSSFGEFVYYVFQTSTYWRDSKKGITNAFTKENYIEMNETKRKTYNKWLHSIPTTTDNYNDLLTSIMRRVF